MDEDYRKLVAAVIEAHPGPWKQGWGCDDHGGMHDTIEDANGSYVYNAEYRVLSKPVLNLLLSFPEMAKDLLAAEPSKP